MLKIVPKTGFFEYLNDDGQHRGLIAIAPHGGQIEPHTDKQAEHVAKMLRGKGVSSWRCKGFDPSGKAFERWHITSTEINEQSFPLLGRVVDRGFSHAVAFHGFRHECILVGGGASPELKLKMASAIWHATNGEIEVSVADPDDAYSGFDPANIVNRLTKNGGGIQLEQSLIARKRYWRQIADAVVFVYCDLV